MKFLKKNIKEKVLALMATLVIWVVVVSRSERQMNFDIPVKITASDDKVLINKVPEKININVKGNSFDFVAMKENNSEIYFDISQKKIGVNNVYLKPEMFDIPKSVIIQKIVPEHISFEVDEKREKTVKVDPYLDGQPKKGYRVEKVEVSPDEVVVSGPATQINRTESITTESLSLNNRTESFNIKKGLLAGSKLFDIESDFSEVEVSVEIVKDIRTMTFRDVPLELSEKENAEFIPETMDVVLEGPLDIMEKIRNEGFYLTVETKPERIYFTKNITVDLPYDEVVLVKIQKKRVKVIKER